MITVFNRSELTVCGTLEQSQKVSAALEQAGIEYHVASHSRTSPSVFSAGTRERSGTFGQSAADSWTYTIYVKRLGVYSTSHRSYQRDRNSSSSDDTRKPRENDG